MLTVKRGIPYFIGDMPPPARLVTVLTTHDGSPANKIVRTSKGEAVLEATRTCEFVAKVVAVETLTAFKNLIASLDASSALILGFVPGFEDGTPFRIMSQSKLQKLIGLENTESTSGFFFEVPGYAQPVLARLGTNFQFSQWRMFDYDPNEHMDKVYASADQWVAELRAAIPGLGDVGMVVSRSSSQRVMFAGEPVREGKSLHAFVLAEPHQTPPDWGLPLYVHMVNSERTYRHPICSRKKDDFGRILRHDERPTVYDRAAILGANRLVFEGAPYLDPQAADSGFKVANPQIDLYEGGPWDTKKVPLPVPPEVDRFESKTGARIKSGSGEHERQNNYIDRIFLEEETLILDSVLEGHDGEFTVRDYCLGTETKVRVQADWRGSISWNAFIARHKDGSPFVFDNGTATKYVLSEGSLNEMAVDLLHQLLERIEDEADELDPSDVLDDEIALSWLKRVRKHKAGLYERFRKRVKSKIRVTVLDQKVNAAGGQSGTRQARSHAEVANALLGDLKQAHDNNVVGCFGRIFTEASGVWTGKELREIAGNLVANSQFDGTPYCSRHSDYRSIASLKYDACVDERFFADSPTGIAINGKYYRVSALGIDVEDLSPKHRCRFSIDIEPRSGDMPMFNAHLARTFDRANPDWTKGAVANYQELLGAALTGALGLSQRAVLLVDRGLGATGKSTTLEFLQEMIPPEFRCSISPMDWGKSGYLAQLAGKHLNLVGELNNQIPIPAAHFKNITGHDPVSARRLYEAPFYFTCETGHVLASNHFIVTRDHTDAFYRRWRVIPFLNQVPESDRQQHYASTVWNAEAAQILDWALEGAVRFVGHGFSDSLGHDEYMRLWRKNTDSVRHFFLDSPWIEIIEKRPASGWISRTEAYRLYNDWCVDFGMRPVSANNFYETVASGQITGVSLVKGDSGVRQIKGAAKKAKIVEALEGATDHAADLFTRRRPTSAATGRTGR